MVLQGLDHQVQVGPLHEAGDAGNRRADGQDVDVGGGDRGEGLGRAARAIPEVRAVDRDQDDIALVDHFGEKFISYSLTTVHAATNSQSVLDQLPKAGDKDTRKRRSIINSMIPTSTGAAGAVLEVIPEIREMGIGSQASSIRVPTNTGSIVILDVTLMGEYDNTQMHAIFKEYSAKFPDIMKFSTEQLVSADIVGSRYSTIYDSPFTHRRTSKRGDQLFTMVDLNFWYDNEFGYACSLLRLYDHIAGRR